MNNSNTLCSQEVQVLVFKTNLTDSISVQKVDEYLQSVKGIYHTSVDLEDWEKVLRIECHSSINSSQVKNILTDLGYSCTDLVH